MPKKKSFFLMITLAVIPALLIGGIAGYKIASTSSSQAAGPFLQLSATIDYDADDQIIRSEETNTTVQLHNLREVTISVDGSSIPLEKALQDQTVSPAVILAYAKIDAANRHCVETYTSENGLAEFRYRYDTYELAVIHDIYETPDGKQHMISSLDISEPGGLNTMNRAYYDENTLLPLDREDWGLTFEEPVASATGLTLPYSHTGGQQIGKLQAESYQIFLEDTKEPAQPLNSDDAGTLLDPGQFLTLNAGGEIVIDWTQSHGNLPSGTYILRLTVLDVYEESQCHPLMRNYHDTQTYEIIFKII